MTTKLVQKCAHVGKIKLYSALCGIAIALFYMILKKLGLETRLFFYNLASPYKGMVLLITNNVSANMRFLGKIVDRVHE